MQVGTVVILALAVLTAVEYAIAIEVEQNLLPIVFIAQVKAALIVWYFMRLARAWLKGEH
ncbi:MAG TPA: cytochrome C oxidase subunit IV family protein [Dehalococcoidia bacterium]|nr:cytochrome C oxidase subunit IV family protein [Dehalococcoidia bacterium]